MGNEVKSIRNIMADRLYHEITTIARSTRIEVIKQKHHPTWYNDSCLFLFLWSPFLLRKQKQFWNLSKRKQYENRLLFCHDRLDGQKSVYLIRQEANKLASIDIKVFNHSHECAVRCDAIHRIGFKRRYAGCEYLQITIALAKYCQRNEINTTKVDLVIYFSYEYLLFTEETHVQSLIRYLLFISCYFFCTKNRTSFYFCHKTGGFERKWLIKLSRVGFARFWFLFSAKRKGYRLSFASSYKMLLVGTSSYLKYFTCDSWRFEVVWGKNCNFIVGAMEWISLFCQSCSFRAESEMNQHQQSNYFEFSRPNVVRSYALSTRPPCVRSYTNGETTFPMTFLYRCVRRTIQTTEKKAGNEAWERSFKTKWRNRIYATARYINTRCFDRSVFVCRVRTQSKIVLTPKKVQQRYHSNKLW